MGDKKKFAIMFAYAGARLFSFWPIKSPEKRFIAATLLEVSALVA